MKRFVPVLFCGLTSLLSAQTIEVGQPYTLCPGDSVTIHADVDSSQFILLDDPTVLTINDDAFSALVPIGFDFTFYGNTYNQLVIGANGTLTFDATKANGYNAWNISSIPSPMSPVRNSILAPWMDMSFSSGSLKFQTLGTAPNRRFVVFYNAPAIVDPTCQGAPSCWSTAIVLYETSNVIDVFIQDKPYCGYALQGVQNSTGTLAAIVPGRNGGFWSCGNDGKRFTPVAGNYTVTDIPFQPVFDSPLNIYWANTSGSLYSYTGEITVTGSVNWDVAYWLVYMPNNACNSWPVTLSDTSWLDQLLVPGLTTVDDFCSTGSGAIYSDDPSTTDASFTWTSPAVSSDTLTGLTAGSYAYFYEDANGCSFDGIVEVGNNTGFTVEAHNSTCMDMANGWAVITPDNPALIYNWIFPANAAGSGIYGQTAGTYTCYVQAPGGCSDTVEIVIGTNNTTTIDTLIVGNESCPGLSDGSFTAVISGGQPNSQYELGNIPLPSPEADSLEPGFYTLEVYNGSCSYSVPVTIAPATPIDLSAQVTDIVGSGDGSVIITATGGTPGYTFTLNGNTQTDGSFGPLTAGMYSCLVTDANGCTETIAFSIDDVTGIDALSDQNWKVFPNPTTGELFVSGIEGSFGLTVEDLSGKRCLVVRVEDGSAVSVAALPAGMYQLTLVQDGHVYRSRLTVND